MSIYNAAFNRTLAREQKKHFGAPGHLVKFRTVDGKKIYDVYENGVLKAAAMSPRLIKQFFDITV